MYGIDTLTSTIRFQQKRHQSLMCKEEKKNYQNEVAFFLLLLGVNDLPTHIQQQLLICVCVCVIPSIIAPFQLSLNYDRTRVFLEFEKEKKNSSNSFRVRFGSSSSLTIKLWFVFRFVLDDFVLSVSNDFSDVGSYMNSYSL